MRARRRRQRRIDDGLSRQPATELAGRDRPASVAAPRADVGGAAGLRSGRLHLRDAYIKANNARRPVFFYDFVYARGANSAFRHSAGDRLVTYDGNGVVLGDFTSKGNNRSGQADGYYASNGYNLCTGWGSPNGAELLAQLQAWLAA